MKNPITHKKADLNLSLWATETCDGLMFLGTSIIAEEECISKIKKGFELCDFIDKLPLVSAETENSSIDVDTFIALKRVASNKSLLDYESFKKIKEKTKEIKNALTEIIENPNRRDKKLEENQLIFSQLARLFVGVSS